MPFTIAMSARVEQASLPHETAQIGRVSTGADTFHVRVLSQESADIKKDSNGVAPAPVRASPAAPQVPNGKPTSSPGIVTSSNPMSSGNDSPIPQTVASRDPKAAAAAASEMRNIVRRKLTGFVGFANLPNQWHRKSVRKGFNFNVMVVGMYIITPWEQSTFEN